MSRTPFAKRPVISRSSSHPLVEPWRKSTIINASAQSIRILLTAVICFLAGYGLLALIGSL